MIAYIRRAAWDLRLLKCRIEDLIPFRNELRIVFVVGCGRSGTTLLADVLARRPEILVFNEPRDRWYIVDPRTDDIGLYGRPGRLDLGVEDANGHARTRRRLISAPLSFGRRSIVVNKSPSNIFRMHWLRELFPNCQFINIIRDGRAVADSIVRLAYLDEYKFDPAHRRNQWWGLNYCKRNLVLDRAARTGLLSGPPETLEPKTLDSTAAVAEWIMSVDEGNAMSVLLPPDKILTVRYESLLADSISEVRRILHFLQLSDQNLPASGLAGMIKNDGESAVRFSTAEVDSVTKREMQRRLVSLGYMGSDAERELTEHNSGAIHSSSATIDADRL